MSALQPILIGGYQSGGLVTDKKPFLLPDQAYSNLENAYVWRDRTKKRDGTLQVGRLRRFFASQSLGTSGASVWSFNIYTLLSITPEPNAEIAEGSVIITIASLGTPFNDQGNGALTNTTLDNFGTINYMTGDVTITYTTVAAAAEITFGYYPALQVMGIAKRDVPSLGIDQTVFFDTKYAYQFVGEAFQELSPGTVWSAPNNSNGTNTNFFWSTNYQGADPSYRYFFTTNNNINLSAPSFDPMYYYNNSTWNALTPLVTSTITLWQALILVPYYGRLLALNTWEGLTVDTYTGASNFASRCRFSQLGDPTAADAWRVDEFGKGGFLDAPTNEQIVGAAFFRNTLIVFFEYSTWQLRYIGEYGLPFIFERISSDFGSVSTFSSIIFDAGVMAVSDRGIIQAGANGIKRLDEQIPETVFSFGIQNNAPDFVHGARNFEKEVVYWNYIDTSSSDSSNPGLYQVFPNQTLLYNYRNETWANFRDTVSCFGTAQFQFSITWDSFTTFWDSDVLWDNSDDQQYVDYVTAGSQQGFILIYENQEAATPVGSTTMFAASMAITAFNFGVSPTQITVPNHNLNNAEIVYINGVLSASGSIGINNQLYQVAVIDQNTIILSLWQQATLNYVPQTFTTETYIGGGQVALIPVMNIVGKDFNPYQGSGKQFKLSYIDFQMDTNNFNPAIPAVTIQLFVNSYLGEQANLLAGSNQELVNSTQTSDFITNAETGVGNPLANPCTITSPNHSLLTGIEIYIQNILGTTQLNGVIYTITVVDANTFTLNGIDASAFTTYVSGGTWVTVPAEGQTYIPGSQYAWYRFYSTQYGQYLRIAVTYDDSLMNQVGTHQTAMELNAMNVWVKEAGRLIN